MKRFTRSYVKTNSAASSKRVTAPTIRIAFLAFALLFSAALSAQSPQQTGVPSQQTVTAVPPLTVDPLPPIPDELRKRVISYNTSDRGLKDYRERNIKGCMAGDGENCAVISGLCLPSCMQNVGTFTRALSGWDKADHYRDVAKIIDYAVARRSCALGDTIGCNFYAINLLRGGQTADAIRVLHSTACLRDRSCEDTLSQLTPQQRAVADSLTLGPVAEAFPGVDLTTGKVPFVPVPEIPDPILNHAEARAKSALANCRAETGGVDECYYASGLLFSKWVSENGYRSRLDNVQLLLNIRACALNSWRGCASYARSLESAHRDAEANLVWTQPACLADSYCASRGTLVASASTPTHDHSTLLAVMGAVNDGLSQMNDSLAQQNAQQAAQNAAQMQQAQALVAANDARRAQQAEAARQAAAREALARQSQPHPAATTTTIASTGTVAPPVVYQPPASTGGTVVGPICPANGFTGQFTSYGDAAVAIRCSPGQPIAGASGSGGPTTITTSTTGSGTSGDIVSGLNQCIAESFTLLNPGDTVPFLTFTNGCAQSVRITWIVGPSGTLRGHTFAIGEVLNQTGSDQNDVHNQGGVTFYACPADHPVAVDPNGNQILSPVSTYKCAKHS